MASYVTSVNHLVHLFPTCILKYDFFLQPAFLVDVFAAKESTDVQCSNVDSVKQPANEASFGPQGSKKSSLVDALLHYVDRASDLINRYIFCILFILYWRLLFDRIDMVTFFLGFTL